MSKTRNWLCLILAAVIAVPTGIGFALAAEQPSAEDIIKALKPARLTRGLSAAPRDTARTVDDQRFIETLRNRTSRSLTSDERSRIASMVQDKPSIDLEINFEFNSAVIGQKAAQQIKALGEALTSPDLKGRTFVLAGHTDAKGDTNYNQSLSEQRSDAVKRYLIDKHGIESGQLLTVGHGKARLKNATRPFAAENRRVQIVNVAEN